MKFSIGVRVVLANVIGCAGGLMAAETGPARPKQDAKGNPIRYAATGHASNDDEAKAGPFVLPDPLVLQNGKPMKDAATWNTVRRPELIALYGREIFGAVPTRVPKVSAEVVATEVGALGGKAVRKHLGLRFGEGERAVALNVSRYVPTRAAKPKPLGLQLLFSNPPGISQLAKMPFDDAVPVEDIVGRGYAYAAFRHTEAQGGQREDARRRRAGARLRAGADAAGGGQVGHDHDVGVDHEPRARRPRISGDRGREAGGARGALAVGEDGAVGGSA